MSGIDITGFTRERLVDIRSDIITDIQSRFKAAGISSDIETRPDSIFGLMIDTFAEREATLWEIAQSVYNAMYPDTAVGTNLDKAVSFVGVTRQKEEFSSGYVCFYSNGTLVNVPRGTQINQPEISQVWKTTVDAKVSNLTASDVQITPKIGTGYYRVTIDGVVYTWTETVGSVATILAGLVSVLSGSGHKVSSNGAAIRITIQGELTAQVTLSSNLVFAEIGTNIAVESEEYTSQGADVGEINTLVKPLTNITKVSNIIAATAGRMAETDADLRKRYLKGEFSLGAATATAVKKTILEVSGVTECRVFENNGNAVDENGRAAHSIECVVENGLNREIAKAIYDSKAAGITSYGTSTEILETEEGKQVISFSRPSYQYVTVKAVLILSKDSNDGIFPSSGYDDIKAAILALGDTLTIGKDVLIQKLYKACYATDGVLSVSLTIGASNNATTVPNLETKNIVISSIQKALFDASRITVTS